jgi:hypothetical protein
MMPGNRYKKNGWVSEATARGLKEAGRVGEEIDRNQ